MGGYLSSYSINGRDLNEPYEQPPVNLVLPGHLPNETEKILVDSIDPYIHDYPPRNIRSIPVDPIPRRGPLHYGSASACPPIYPSLNDSNNNSNNNLGNFAHAGKRHICTEHQTGMAVSNIEGQCGICEKSTDSIHIHYCDKCSVTHHICHVCGHQ
jgi:hypothetical protein